MRRSLLVFLILMVAGGCAYVLRFPAIKRESAVGYIEYWLWQRERQLKRWLTPEKREVAIIQIKAELEGRINQYIATHPNISDDDKWRLREAYIQVGKKRKDEILVQLAEPAEVTRDPGRMAELARKYWLELKEKERVNEAWVYHGDPRLWDHHFVLYFQDNDLIAITEFYWEPLL